jgi:glycosyltransferase involved in cell wall biosynthesis
MMTSEKRPLVSIVMNCYNSDRFLKEAIDSVYAQSFSDWEIIFWDNASTDKSAEIAKSYDKRLKYFCVDETTPLGEARKHAINKAESRYIAFLDCDDMYLPEKLNKQVQFMEEGQYAMSYSGAIVIDENGKTIRRIAVKNKSGYVFGELLEKYEINMQTVMVRREILEQEGIVFQSNLRYCPDHNLFMEIASRARVGVIHDFMVKYRVLSDSLSRKTLHLVSSEIKYTLDRILERDPIISDRFPGPIKAAYAKLSYYDAINNISQGNLKKARTDLKSVLSQRWQYIVLYFILFLPLQPEVFLRLLKR